VARGTGTVVDRHRRRRPQGLGRVLVVGDSLGVGTAPNLRRRLGGVGADVEVGRSSAEGVRVLEQRLRDRHGAVVFDLGTNDPTANDLRRSLRQASNIAGDRDIYLSTVNGPDARDKNQLLKRFARRHENVHLIRGAQRIPTGPDGIHYSPQGYDARAQLYARSIRRSGGQMAGGPYAHAAGRQRGGGGRSRGFSSGPWHRRYADEIWDAYQKYGVLPKHLAGLIEVESGGDPNAVSSAGAEGLTQFIPSTAQSYGVKYGDSPRAIRSQIMGAAHYLKDLGYRRGDRGAIHNAFQSYNAGPGNPSAAGAYGQHVFQASTGYQGLGKLGRQVSGGMPTGGAGGGGGGLRIGSGPTSERATVGPGGTGIAAMVAAMMDQQPQIGSSLPAPPAFAAGAAFPAGYQPPQSSGSAAPPPPDIEELMALVQPGEGIPQTEVSPGTLVGGAGGGGGRRGGGAAPGGFNIPNYGPSGGVYTNPTGAPIDRAGVPTNKATRAAVKGISSILGSPVAFGTGTAHSQMTSSGNVSEHWGGDAIDLPSSGRRLFAIGRSALILAGMDPKQARKHRGGIVNINGWQIIFNAADHYDHVHVSPPDNWRIPRWLRRPGRGR
jgi:hypothetical protein